jgi:hypothetical protein
MNSDAVASMVRQVLTLLLSSAAASTYVSGDQAVAIATGAAALVSVLWSVWSHYGMRKVPEKSIVTSSAPTVADAKAISAPAEAVAAAK